VSAELFSEGKTNRYGTAVVDISGICVTSWCVLYRRLAVALCLVQHGSWRILRSWCYRTCFHQSYVAVLWQACLYGSRVISSFVVLQARITLQLPSVKSYWRLRIPPTL
jgi:hypothetical protein